MVNILGISLHKDVTEIMYKLLKNNKKLKSNDILNVCSNKQFLKIY